MASYRELKVWQRAMELVVLVYELTKKFPKDELYGLVSQIRRSVISLPSNITEGQGRQSSKDFKQFLSIARASLNELETQIEIANRLNYIDKFESDRISEITTEVGKMINGLRSSLQF